GEGEYTIRAEQLEQGVTVQEAEQVITIVGEGAYTVDMIVLPTFGDEPIPFPEDDPPIGILDQLFQNHVVWWGLLIIVLGASAGAYFYIQKNASTFPKEEVRIEKKEETSGETAKDFLDEYAKEVLTHLHRGGNRLNQKELREKMNIGEAKVSLVVTELESYGLVKKIKKGRGNILILTPTGIEKIKEEKIIEHHEAKRLEEKQREEK
ncbi:MAG: hypothetical protein AABY11_01140, partial [archaeon]